MKDSRFQYCVDNEDVYLQGTRDSATLKQEHAYIVYEIWRCTDDPSRKMEGYPDCAPQEEIEAWMSSKLATMKVINTKIDFLDRGDFAVRYNEIFIPSVSIAWG